MGKLKDLTGLRYGRLTVLRFSEMRGRKSLWECQCECGRVKIIRSDNLQSGDSTSCGCYKQDLLTKHGDYSSRLYGIWHSMRHRCLCPTSVQYKDYGGRGISICDEWADFSVFREWALTHGYDESASKGQCTLDRIDNNGNYCPENCRWVSILVQDNNKRNNVILSFDGKEQTIADWARELSINYVTLYSRIHKQGWSIARALTTPTMTQFSRR